MQKVTPCLWCDNNAKERMDYYSSVFPDCKIISNHPMMCRFEMSGQQFLLLNGGDRYKHNPAVSMYIACNGQEEVDLYWDKLLQDGGEESRCGWIIDKYGLSWQIIPKQLMELMGNQDQVKSERVMGAMMKMNKIVVKGLEEAFEGN